MTIWMIISWILVALLTAGNIVFFIKLRKASQKMLQMAFPGAKNFNEALMKMEGMMQYAKNASSPFGNAPGGMPAHLKGAMSQLEQLIKNQKR